MKAAFLAGMEVGSAFSGMVYAVLAQYDAALACFVAAAYFRYARSGA